MFILFSFYFDIKNLQVEAIFASLYLELSLLVFLKCI